MLFAPPGDWENVLENAFPMIQPHFPTIFLIFQCCSETLSDRQMEAVASLLSTFKIHLILGDMFVSERFVREKSVPQEAWPGAQPGDWKMFWEMRSP